MLALSLNMAFIISFFTFVPLFGNKVVANLNDLLSIAWLVCNTVWMKWFRNCNGHSRLARLYQFTTKHTHRDFKHLPTSDCQRTHHQTRPAPNNVPSQERTTMTEGNFKQNNHRWISPLRSLLHWMCFSPGCSRASRHFPTSSLLPPPHKKKKQQRNICWQKASLQSHSVTCPTISRFITLAMVQVTVWEQLHTCI